MDFLRRYLCFRRMRNFCIPKKLRIEPQWILENEKNLKVRDLGYGGCGKTQLWEISSVDKPVCLKNLFDPTTRYKDTVKEAEFLIRLRGAGGAPRVHGVAPEIGCYFMDFLPGRDLEELSHEHKTGTVLQNDWFWLDVLEKLIVKLKEVHRKQIVHLDLKQNNVMVDLSDPADPKISIIDFGVSSFVGDKWVLGDRTLKNVDKFLKFSPWYSYEASIGLPVAKSCDTVAICYMISQFINMMDRKPHQLQTLATQGMSHDVSARPTLKKILKTTRRIKTQWQKKFD